MSSTFDYNSKEQRDARSTIRDLGYDPLPPPEDNVKYLSTLMQILAQDTNSPSDGGWDDVVDVNPESPPTPDFLALNEQDQEEEDEQCDMCLSPSPLPASAAVDSDSEIKELEKLVSTLNLKETAQNSQLAPSPQGLSVFSMPRARLGRKNAPVPMTSPVPFPVPRPTVPSKAPKVFNTVSDAGSSILYTAPVPKPVPVPAPIPKPAPKPLTVPAKMAAAMGPSDCPAPTKSLERDSTSELCTFPNVGQGDCLFYSIAIGICGRAKWLGFSAAQQQVEMQKIRNFAAARMTLDDLNEDPDVVFNLDSYYFDTLETPWEIRRNQPELQNNQVWLPFLSGRWQLPSGVYNICRPDLSNFRHIDTLPEWKDSNWNRSFHQVAPGLWADFEKRRSHISGKRALDELYGKVARLFWYKQQMILGGNANWANESVLYLLTKAPPAPDLFSIANVGILMLVPRDPRQSRIFPYNRKANLYLAVSNIQELHFEAVGWVSKKNKGPDIQTRFQANELPTLMKQVLSAYRNAHWPSHANEFQLPVESMPLDISPEMMRQKLRQKYPQANEGSIATHLARLANDLASFSWLEELLR